MRAYALALAAVFVAPAAVHAAGPRLTPPVPATIARGFDYAGDPFASGLHRGIDLAAAPGTPVGAACSGRVVFAGHAGANGRAVTLRCGAWNVTHLPLASLAVRAGRHVAARSMLGKAGATRGHRGIHLGVRRAGDPFGYVDPALLLHDPTRPAPPAAPAGPRTRPHGPPPAHPVPLPSTQRPAPAVRPAPQAAAPAPRPATGSSPLAPWPAWAGLALLLAGALGAGGARVARTRRAPLPRAVAREVP